MMQDELFGDPPYLPYAGTSGWSVTDTSRERAFTADATGETKYRQQAATFYVFREGAEGVTWKELGDIMGWHHGVASSVLSVLHKEGVIARLSERRDRCKVYVHADFVNGRDVEPHGRKAKPCSNCGHVEES